MPIRCFRCDESFTIGDAIDYGMRCPSCNVALPVCDDCDTIVEGGDYHLCAGCEARRSAERET